MPPFDFWAPDPGHISLGEDEIHVWRVYFDCERDVFHRFEAILTPDEKDRANRFFFERDRSAFVATRAVLRRLLGRYLGDAPAHLLFGYGSLGKPFLRAGPIKSDIQFNVSHSQGLALLAFARGRELGVDVELVRPDFASEEIAERYFSPAEVAELRGLSPELRAEGFFNCWTRKESYIKARGEGLHIPLDSFDVSLTPGQPERLQSADRSLWSLRTLRPAPRYVGALVGQGQSWQLRCWEWKW
jgi:4'-phosphopantetheinyl transferase